MAEHADGGLAVWVYGVMRGDAPDLPRCAGVDGRHDTEVIRHAGLAAVASSVSLEEYGHGVLERSLEDLERLEALARAHQQVLDEALRLGPVVPMRICTIYDGADNVRDMLERAHRSLTDALDRLAGTAEWGVKAFLAPQGPPAVTPGGGAPASGAEYLARKHSRRAAAQSAQEAADAAVELVHRRLSEHAVDAVLNRVQDRRLSGREQEMILNAAYLVADARIEGFRSLVAELAGRHAKDGVLLELTGPWPAYHFAGAAAAA